MPTEVKLTESVPTLSVDNCVNCFLTDRLELLKSTEYMLESTRGKYNPEFSLSFVLGIPKLNGTVNVEDGNVPVHTPLTLGTVSSVNANPSDDTLVTLLKVSKLFTGFLYFIIASLLIPIKFLPGQVTIPALLIVIWSEIENDDKLSLVKTVSATKSTLNPKEEYKVLVSW